MIYDISQLAHLLSNTTPKRAQLQVVGPKRVAPLGNAVGLVHDKVVEQIAPGQAGQNVPDVVQRSGLGRDVEEAKTRGSVV